MRTTWSVPSPPTYSRNCHSFCPKPGCSFVTLSVVNSPKQGKPARLGFPERECIPVLKLPGAKQALLIQVRPKFQPGNVEVNRYDCRHCCLSDASSAAHV